MVINQTVIPDIPEEVLSAYSYVVIAANGTTSFYLYAATVPMLYVSDGAYVSAGEYITATYTPPTDSTATKAWSETSTVTGTTISFSSAPIAWSNHELYTGASDGNGGYTATEEVSFGEAYIIPHGITAIPAGLLNQYPHACVTMMMDSPYQLVLSSNKLSVLNAGDLSSMLGGADSELAEIFGMLFSGDMQMIMTPDAVYSHSSGKWTLSDSTSAMAGFMMIGIVWTNHDMNHAEFVGVNTDEFVVLDGIAAYKNCPAFPKVPDWVHESYPYQALFSAGMDGDVVSMYYLSPEPIYGFAEDGITMLFGNVDFTNTYVPPLKPYMPTLMYFAMGASWMVRHEGVISYDTLPYGIPFALLMAEFGFGITDPKTVWANHNIKLVDGDFTTIQATDEVIVEGTGVVRPPDKYVVSRDWLVANAYKIRRLTGIFDELTPKVQNEAIGAVAPSGMADFILTGYLAELMNAAGSSEMEVYF